MPYKMTKNGSPDKPYCVTNSETSEKKGCSETRAKAVAHMRALYAAESGEKMRSKEVDDLVLKSVADFSSEYEEFVTPEEILGDPDMDEKDYYSGDVPTTSYTGMSTSYEEYEQMREAWEKARKADELLSLFPSLARNAIYVTEGVPGDENKDRYKQAADKIEALSEELAVRLRSISTSKDEEYDDEKALSEVADEIIDKAVSKREDVSEAEKRRATGEYGDVRYADPKNKKYPIDTAPHIRAAWNYINMPRNSGKYSSGEAKTIKSRIVSAWKSKIDKEGPPSAQKMKSDLGLLAEHAAYYLKSILGKDEEEAEPDIEFFKEKDGRTTWIARYSNNFIDRDNPPDIISEKSHRRYVEMIDKGVYPYPVLELWHQKEWAFGQAEWCAYDDSGIAIAGGYIYPGCEPIAKEISQLPDVALSHGMPKESLRRDEKDKRVIIEHQTKEISVLPQWMAANELTSNGFELLHKEADMLPKDQKVKLLKRWGLSEDRLAALEALNEKTADKALEAGLENKEKGDAAVDTTVETPAPDATPKPEGEKPVEPAQDDAAASEEFLNGTPTRKELADALGNILQTQVDVISDIKTQVEGITKQMSALSVKSDAVEEKVEKAASMSDLIKQTTPVAALMAMWGDTRAVGSSSAKIDKEDSLTKGGPKENEDQGEGERLSSIPFIDQMLKASVPK